ncbi:hypothetical protein NQZ68_002412 [Dissostichus eleginoides]|nr:hypothetical protein NQZ68_002412 [Dissostichus eleginoides]
MFHSQCRKTSQCLWFSLFKLTSSPLSFPFIFLSCKLLRPCAQRCGYMRMHGAVLVQQRRHVAFRVSTDSRVAASTPSLYVMT